MSGGKSQDAHNGRWGDLSARVFSGAIMIAIGGAAIFAGGLPMHFLLAAICAMILWEICTTVAPHLPRHAIMTAAIAGFVFAFVSALGFSQPAMLLLLFLPALICARLYKNHRLAVFLWGSVVLWAIWAMMILRDFHGIAWLLWLVGLVILTDTAGYFAGRIIGGPKLIPRFSPKKTWSGAIAGWLAAAVFGAFFAKAIGLGLLPTIGLSVVLSMGSQIGDISQSAFKRAFGVKDSSNLIPGHGGFFDRFDGMIGASVMMLIFAAILMVVS